MPPPRTPLPARHAQGASPAPARSGSTTKQRATSQAPGPGGNASFKKRSSTPERKASPAPLQKATPAPREPSKLAQRKSVKPPLNPSTTQSVTDGDNGSGMADASNVADSSTSGEALAPSAATNKMLVRLINPKARGAAAKSYATRINKTFGWTQSAAELLFYEKPTELVVVIDAAHDHATVSALQLSRALTLTAIRRPKARKDNVGTTASQKVEMGDELVLRGLPYHLAGVAVLKSKQLVLAPRHARDKAAPTIRAERQSLIAAAEALQARLLPMVHVKAEANRAKKRTRDAIVRLQSVRRGQLLRRSTASLLEAHRAKKRAGKLRSRKLMASLLAACYNEPICTKACFTPTPSEEAAESVAQQSAWARAHPALAMRYACQTATCRTHTATFNRYLSAAPEGKRRKGGEKLPLSPLSCLTTGSLELTAVIDKRGNNMTVSQLQLPKSVVVARLTVNNRSVAVKNQTALNATKLLVNDAVVLRGLPHHIAAVCDAKGGKLALAPPKARRGGAQLKRERLSLLASASRLASTLQGLARSRLALRQAHRQAHAALVIQIEYATYAAEKKQRAVSFRAGAPSVASTMLVAAAASAAAPAAVAPAPIVHAIEEVTPLATSDVADAVSETAGATAAPPTEAKQQPAVEEAEPPPPRMPTSLASGGALPSPPSPDLVGHDAVLAFVAASNEEVTSVGASVPRQTGEGAPESEPAEGSERTADGTERTEGSSEDSAEDSEGGVEDEDEAEEQNGVDLLAEVFGRKPVVRSATSPPSKSATAAEAPANTKGKAIPESRLKARTGSPRAAKAVGAKPMVSTKRSSSPRSSSPRSSKLAAPVAMQSGGAMHKPPLMPMRKPLS